MTTSWIELAIQAFCRRPTRAEPLYDLARFYREKPDMQAAALIFAEAGLEIPKPDDILFVEDYPYEWGFKEEYSICGYYSANPVVRARAHAYCEELALSRDAPPATREQAWRNLFSYARPLAAQAPSLRTQRIDFTPPDNFHPCNPSVCRLRDKMYLNVRAVNYLIGQDGRYAMPADGNFVGRTRNFLFELDNDLHIGKPVELKLPPSIPEAFAACLGFEDLRLFTDDSYLWASATSRQHNTEGWCDIVTAVIDWRDGRMGAERILQPEGERRQQKNWIPIIGNEPRWIYSCDPVRVLGRDGQTLLECPSPVASTEWSGSSQAIPFTVYYPPGKIFAYAHGYLALIHERQAYPDPMRGQRNYQRRFVWFDADFNIRRISRRFFFGDGEGEFVCGMCWHPDGQRLVISYGVLDREAWLATVDANEVRSMLREVSDAGNNRSYRPLADDSLGHHDNHPSGGHQRDTEIRLRYGDDGRDRLGVRDTPAAGDRHRDGGLNGGVCLDRGDYPAGADPGDHQRNGLEEAASGRFGIFSDHAPQSAIADLWLERNTNAALRTEADLAFAINAVTARGWPVHPDRTKNWDCYIALRHAMERTSPSERILDAGADRISTFLPTLEKLGYRWLTGINKIFDDTPDLGGAIIYRRGDIEGSPYPNNHFAFIACLSTIEHGVNVPKFLAEAARILRPGGHLFISTDYWPEPMHTNIDEWRIMTSGDIMPLIACAIEHDLHLTSQGVNLGVIERVCHHGGCDYTFVNLLFEKAA